MNSSITDLDGDSSVEYCFVNSGWSGFKQSVGSGGVSWGFVDFSSLYYCCSQRGQWSLSAVIEH